MVHVNDSVRSKLYRFISRDEGTDIWNGAGLYIFHLLGEDEANDYRFVEGIYRFRLMGPHFPPYYFIYTQKDGIQIIENYTVEGMFTQLIECFKRNEESFNERKKIAYIKIIIDELEHRNDVYEHSENLQKR
ncbi:MAG: hypothetical protein Q8859_03570 [Bacteroidota bacterium]|nr:hypothetical protein [Bacteroidota bacterium]